MSPINSVGALGAALALLAFSVPAQAQATNGVVSTAVLGRTVQRGELLTVGDFTVEEVAAGSAREALAPRDAAGLEAKRTLRAGMPVRMGDLAEPRVVRRGEHVKIVLRDGALTITAAGRALGDAAIGEPVRVFSEATNQTLETVAEGTASVRIAAH